MNVTAACCSFWVARNSFKFLNTCSDRFISIDGLFAFFYIQGCSSAYFADSLSSGSISIILDIKSSHDSSIYSQSDALNFNYPFYIISKVSVSLLPQNGGYPHSNMYKITPADHISHFSV